MEGAEERVLKKDLDKAGNQPASPSYEIPHYSLERSEVRTQTTMDVLCIYYMQAVKDEIILYYVILLLWIEEVRTMYRRDGCSQPKRRGDSYVVGEIDEKL